jgi:formylglycine-generating enzyme required for sulfatase activity
MESNPSYFKGDNLPVERVSWYDAVEYCNRRSEKEGLTPAYMIDKNRSDPDNKSEADTIKWEVRWNRAANGYRLPTEAEWEYAAKGGNKDQTVFEYSGSNSPDAVAWYGDNSGGKTHPVGTKQPNSLGLYDMSGNVYEWCGDWYGSYASGSQTDPGGPSSGTYRVIRGGGWYGSASGCAVAYRSNYYPFGRNNFFGFRVVCP